MNMALFKLTVFSLIAIVFISILGYNLTGNIIRNMNTEYLLSHLEESKEMYNENVNSLPGYIKELFKDEIINIKIERESGEFEYVGIIFEKGLIKEIIDEKFENVDLDISVSEKTINKIFNSNDVVKVFLKSLEENEIIYKGKSLETNIKFGGGGSILKIFSRFI